VASIFHAETKAAQPPIHGRLGDAALAIGGPRFDAFFFWGAPLVALIFVWGFVAALLLLPSGTAKDAGAALLLGAVSILTFAHLIAVAPRAYLNREVFGANRRRLIVVPLLLVPALLLSPALLICAGILAVFWDVHHSAMQTFGLGRIYDMKAGGNPQTLRTTDLRLNWALYVGPIATGASLIIHFNKFHDVGRIDWATLATLPGIVQQYGNPIRDVAIAAWTATILWSAWQYRAAMRTGYRLPAHKAALLGATAITSIAAWGFTPPFMAFAIVNIFHAVQYFALVWLKEGSRIHAQLARLAPRGKAEPGDQATRLSLALFLLFCAAFGVAYFAVPNGTWLAAPFIACSLLHFWFDSFVWSVRKKQV
jgi:hypothetical protein